MKMSVAEAQCVNERVTEDHNSQVSKCQMLQALLKCFKCREKSLRVSKHECG